MKMKLKTSLLAGVCSLLLLFPNVMQSSLKEISKPYQGIYECKRAMLGSKDYFSSFTRLQLELKNDEDFSLIYQEKSGEKKRIDGKYRYEEGKIIFIDDKSGMHREFPLENGLLTVSFPVGGKLLVIQFERK